MVGAPACGDVMKLQIRVGDDGRIEDAKFKTYGCGSAIASSSLVTEWVKGKTLDEAMTIRNTAHRRRARVAAGQDPLLDPRRRRDQGGRRRLSREARDGRGCGEEGGLMTRRRQRRSRSRCLADREGRAARRRATSSAAARASACASACARPAARASLTSSSTSTSRSPRTACSRATASRSSSIRRACRTSTAPSSTSRAKA